MHTQNEINNTVTHDNIKKAHVKSAIHINKVHIENNTASNTSKKVHKKLFNKVHKQIKTFNKISKQGIIFDYDKCKSANINKAHANEAKCETDNANSLLHNHILYYFNKIEKIEKILSNHNKYILTSLNKKYSDNRVTLNEFKSSVIN